jgi:5'-methylthioadenosine phosphorylase
VVNGPRFSTRSESLWFASQGWEVINMTQYPEVVLARELELCYVGIALITDYDVGLEGMEGVKPVMADEVARVFKANNQRVKRVVKEMVKRLPKRRRCICSQALNGAGI